MGNDLVVYELQTALRTLGESSVQVDMSGTNWSDVEDLLIRVRINGSSPGVSSLLRALLGLVQLGTPDTSAVHALADL